MNARRGNRRHSPKVAGLATLAALLSLAAVAHADPLLRWDRPLDKLLVGDQATLSVMLDDTLRVRTIELRVAFDPEVVASVDGGPGALFAGFDLYPGFELTEDGRWYGYCVVLGADDWAQGPGELFRWTVRAIAEGSSPVATVEIRLRPPGGGDYPDVALPGTALDVGDITTSPSLPDAVSRLALFPNPFNPRTTVTLTATDGGSGAIDVIDLRGRLVATVWQGNWSPGVVHASWDGRGRSGNAVASGTYVFRLRDDVGKTLDRARGTLAR